MVINVVTTMIWDFLDRRFGLRASGRKNPAYGVLKGSVGPSKGL